MNPMGIIDDILNSDDEDGEYDDEEDNGTCSV